MLRHVEQMQELQLCFQEADTLIRIVFTSWKDV